MSLCLEEVFAGFPYSLVNGLSDLLGQGGIDFLRDVNPFVFELCQAQIIGIIVLLITIPVLVRRWPWSKIEEEPQEELEVS